MRQSNEKKKASFQSEASWEKERGGRDWWPRNRRKKEALTLFCLTLLLLPPLPLSPSLWLPLAFLCRTDCASPMLILHDHRQKETLFRVCPPSFPLGCLLPVKSLAGESCVYETALNHWKCISWQFCFSFLKKLLFVRVPHSWREKKISARQLMMPQQSGWT